MNVSSQQPRGEQLLEEVKRLNQQKEVVDVDVERTKVVVFSCGSNLFAFYGSNILEILPACEIFWVPGLPAFIPGLINIRGDIESVIAISHFLEAPPRDPSICFVALAAKDSFRSGILIDSIHDVFDLPLNALRPPLSTLNGQLQELVVGEFEHDGETVILLDIGKLAARVSI